MLGREQAGREQAGMANGVWVRAAAIVAGLGALAAVVGGGAMMAGLVPTSARPADPAIVVDVLHGTFKAAAARGGAEVRKPETVDLADPGLILLGAQHYVNTCVSCHGGPGMGQSPLALMMRPAPQHLPAVVAQFTDEELFWILREGVRFSAMPAWPAETNFGEIWAVVAFLRQLPDMSADEFAAYRTGTDPGAPVTPWGETGETVASRFGHPSPPVDEYAYLAPTAGWTPIGLDERPLGRCAACHGADGSGAVTNGHAPNLTLLAEADIAAALRGYADGSRPSAIMAVVASALSGDQIAALARHYAALPDVASPAPLAGDSARGALIAAQGLPEQGVPACLSCHGAAVRDRLPLIRPPSLQGQSQPFLLARLDAFAGLHGAATPAPGWTPMPGIAAAMTDADRADVAAYFTTLAPRAVAGPAQAAPTEAANVTAQALVAGVCTRCHEPTLTGDSKGGTPNLTGQGAAYLERQLWAFHAERRMASQMIETASRLTGADIAALAGYLGALPHATGQAPVRETPAVAAGALDAAGALATGGDPARSLPACSACHGADMRADFGLAPRLEGQDEVYLKRRLDTFAEGREIAAYSPMRDIAAALTADERVALARWYAGNAGN
jgi:cytochrome c553